MTPTRRLTPAVRQRPANSLFFGPNGIVSTPNVLRPVEESLLNDSGHQAALWCGRGATALFVALKAAALARGVSSGEVILPAMSCTSPANAALLAGLSPRFADVDAATGLATLESIKKRYTEKTCAVVFINLYGQTADLRELVAWCSEKRIALIEDNAQSLGGKFPDGESVGSQGLFAIYSFNYKKILECGGGALTCRDAHLWEVLTSRVSEWLQAIPDQPEVFQERADAYRNLNQLMAGLYRLRAPRASFVTYKRLVKGLLPVLLEPMRVPETLASSWASRKHSLAERLGKAVLYDQALADAACQVAGGWRSSGVCWRYSLFAPENSCLPALTQRIRSRRFLVSNLYIPVNLLLNDRDHCPVAESLGHRVLNLCVDHTVTGSQVKECGQFVRALLSGKN